MDLPDQTRSGQRHKMGNPAQETCKAEVWDGTQNVTETVLGCSYPKDHLRGKCLVHSPIS
jgi:hypothetical protein